MMHGLAVVILLSLPRADTTPPSSAQPAQPAAIKATIDGLVRTPGAYALEAGATVDTLVTRAGGTTAAAAPLFVLARGAGREQVQCLARRDLVVAAGDQVIVAVSTSRMPIPSRRCEDALAAAASP